jgi:transcriptional activator of cad operon
MDSPRSMVLRIGDWRVDTRAGQMSRGAETVRVDARMMRLLLCLAERPGEVVSIEHLLTHVWAGVVVTPDSVYQAVASLRRLLGDDAKESIYIATVPRLGYRMVAAVGPWVEETEQLRDQHHSTRDLIRRRPVLVLLAIAIVVALTATIVSYEHRTVLATRSVGVLPFRDLTTQGMNEEYFADGITEELIDRLSHVPNLHVPSPAASFYFKDKQLTVPEMAKSLGVSYVLDGSVRKSGSTLRISARLMRAKDGFVLWSESYDRTADDKLAVQDEIATAVTKALRASIE